MNTSLCRKLIRFCMCVAISVNLAACADAPKVVKHTKHVKPVKIKTDDSSKAVKTSGDQEQAAPDIKDTSPDTDTAPVIEMQPQALLILEYKNPGEPDMRQSYVMIPYMVDNTDFPELLESLNQLSENKSVLHNIHMVDTGNKAGDLSIAQLSNGKKLPAGDEIGIGLHLIRFFIDNRQRDAAYIMVDNTKKLLASLSGPDARKKGKQLSAELEILESDVRKTMPFTL